MDTLKDMASNLGAAASGSSSGSNDFAWWSGSWTDAFAIIGIALTLLIIVLILKLIAALKFNCDVSSSITPRLRYIDYNEQIVWITGASSGIGKQMSIMLCQNKCKLILSSRSKNKLEKVANECRQLSHGIEIKILPLDLSDLASLPGKVKEATKMFNGEISLLINNGGLSTRCMAKDSNFDLDEYITKVDYLSHVCITKTLLKHHLQVSSDKENGPPLTIINTGSIAGKLGLPVRTSYCGAKHALSGYMNSLRIELNLLGYGNRIYILTAILGSIYTPLPYSALIDYDKNKQQESVFGQNDDNIMNGLKVDKVCERILAVSYHNPTLGEIWMAKPKELIMLYLYTYFPQFTTILLTKTMGAQYAVVAPPHKKKPTSTNNKKKQ